MSVESANARPFLVWLRFATLGAFGVFSLTLGGLMLLVSGLVAASKQTLITHLKAATLKIKQTASVLLILVGVFNIYTAVRLDLFLSILFP